MEDKIAVGQNNSDIYDVFIRVCVDATNVRSCISNNGTPAALKQPYTVFKYNFDLLYTITGDNKDLIEYNPELLARIEQLLSKKNKVPTMKIIIYGLNLFYQYKRHLVSYKIVNVGVQ